MTERFRELFAYDGWASQRVARVVARALQGLEDAGAGPGGDAAARLRKAALVTSHVFRAQDVWMARIRSGGSGPTDALWDPLPSPELEARARATAARWGDLLDEVGEGSVERTVEYRNSSGREFRHPLDRTLTHVVNHGTHHRGQAVLLLRQAAVPPPVTDHIAFVRQREGE